MEISSDQSARACVILGIKDERLRSALAYILMASNFRVLAAGDAETLRAHLKEENPDVVLFEPSLPDLDAIELCSALRLEKRTRGAAVLVLGAGEDDRDHELLTKGADDCVPRPCAPDALISRIGAVLRIAKDEKAEPRALHFGDLDLDAAAFRVQRNGQRIHLGLKEFRLLEHLMKHPHRVHSRNELQNAVWPPDAQVGSRTVDVHIARLRGALQRAGGRDLIRTVRSVGYSLTN